MNNPDDSTQASEHDDREPSLVNSFTIRNAKDSDLSRIVDLDYEAFGASNTAEDRIVFEHRLLAYPRGCLVVEKQGVVIGYCTSEKWLHEREPEINQDPLLSHEPSGKVLCLTAIAITEQYQHKGLGTLLLQAIISIAKQESCTTILLETGKSWTWYQKFGFRKTGERTQNGSHLIIMQLAL